MKNNDSRIVRFASGSGRNFGKATNQTKSLKSFIDDFRKPTVTPERQRDYNKMNDKDQQHTKAVAGWIYRTQVDGPVRNRGSGLPSDFITFDFDYATPEFLEKLLSDDPGLDCEFFVHSTRRHTPEKPRLRMWVLADQAIPNDLYVSVSRIIAEKFDPDMVHVDKVSFRPAQMMFRPTVSKDQEYVFHRHRGPALDWSHELDVFEMTRGDWRDLSLLPKVPNEELRVVAEKAENPTEKDGPVGDFCRAYDVPAAIEKFLSDKYAPSDDNSAKPRYTYLGGTTTNGAEVQDDGLFLYSHHGSDPCSDMLVNAFDLVRIHLFGDKDKGDEDAQGPMAKRPSFKAMMDFIAHDELYLKAVVERKYDIAAMTADFTDDMVDGEIEIDEDDDSAEIRALVGEVIPRNDDGAPVSKQTPPARANRAKRPPPKKDWIGDLELTQNGDIISNSPNIGQIIQNDLRTRNHLEYNEFHAKVVTRARLSTRLPFIPDFPVHDLVNGEPIQDKHLHAIRMMLEYENGPGKPGYGLRSVTDRDLNSAIEIAAHQNTFHPVREYLTDLKWDGRERAERLWIEYLGVEDNAYTRMVARHFLIGAVARAYEPGHKFDFVPILFGAQGKRKSTMIAILAKSWSGELKGNFRDEKHLVEQMMGCWIMELPELSSFKGSIIEDVKAFISAVVSYVRLSYGKLPKEFPRQCVFIGSTNEEEFLNDPTGNRRWWPLKVTVDMIDTDKLARNVDQIWAEAGTWYHEMRAEHPREKGPLPLHLTDAEAAILAAEAQDAAQNITVVDVLAEAIRDYLDGDMTESFGGKKVHRKQVTIMEVWEHGLGRDKTPNDAEAKSVGRAIRACGWVARPTPVKVREDDGTRKSQKVFYPGPQVLARWKDEEDGTSLI